MINANERQKLLKQITELEQGSIDYFDVEQKFFLIDSENLSSIQTRFYGYSIQADGIYEEGNLTPEAITGLDGRGCYVYVDVRDGQITIKQDLNGCWGIYLFRHGNYFALSNSFFRLLDHVKFRYPLTVNRDCCHYLMISSVSSHAYSETTVNEIRLVERNAVIYIDIAKKTLQTEFIDYKENTLSLNSQKGMDTLDSWVDLWSCVLRNLAQKTNFIQVALSGGFDTRVSFAFLLKSGIDLNKIRIFSIKDELHTHKEDYEIASKIANHYGFALNKSLPERQFLNGSLADAFNVSLYGAQTFSNLPKIWSKRTVDKLYRLDGVGGETVRGNWLRFGTLKNFFEWQMQGVNNYSYALSGELSNSMKNILQSAFNKIKTEYKIEDTDSLYLAQYLYHEARCRHHFGKDLLCNYLMNNVMLTPAFDPKVRKLRFGTKKHPDPHLLMAILFSRYEPDLLTFPFEGGRSIAPETIAYAKKLNKRFPRSLTADAVDGKEFHLMPRDTSAEKILASGSNNKPIPDGLIEDCLKTMFESSKTYGLFTTYFDEELYRYAASYYDTHVFGRVRPMYVICGIAKVLEDVEISKRNYPPYKDMKRFIEQDFCNIHINDDGAAQIINKFSQYFIARIDIKLISKTSGGEFQILSVSDGNAKILKPEWFQKNGIGYVIKSYVGKLKFVAKTSVDGQIQLRLKASDVRDAKDKSKRIPCWIDYTTLIANGKIIFNTLTPAWHDKSYGYDIDVKTDEEITIEVEWQPHLGNT